ncbi:hypothetical protein OPT61_g487 [Boeremia exigua]|uniref:Uncharacterized protein n=1 Tax=Boeremia exigua TaxID=749465 RepID=A0ACC2ITK7_9PLEO|nr:hypothetical protein OPT61_g487 [Boeremia exigua]
MAFRRQRFHDADEDLAISSSDTSEASEDSTPESDTDSPTKHGGYAAGNDMSERQTQKINSGSFGMFNPLALTSGTPRTPDSDKKRRRVKKYSSFNGYSSSRRSKKARCRSQEISERGCEDENDLDLFTPEDSSQSLIDAGFSDEEDLPGETESESVQKTQEYHDALGLVVRANESLQAAETKLSDVATEHTNLSQKLSTIDATAKNKISDILRERDEAIRAASEFADAKINSIRERLPGKKEEYERRLRECIKRKTTIEAQIVQARKNAKRTMATEDILERGGRRNWAD